MEEIATAPRVVALAGGRIAFDGFPAEFFSSRELLAETGLEAPLAARLTASLKFHGHRLPIALTLPELVANVYSGAS